MYMYSFFLFFFIEGSYFPSQWSCTARTCSKKSGEIFVFYILAHFRRVKNFYASRFGNVNVTNTLGVIMQLRDTAFANRRDDVSFLILLFFLFFRAGRSILVEKRKIPRFCASIRNIFSPTEKRNEKESKWKTTRITVRRKRIFERKTGDPPINRGKNDKIAPRSKIGSNRVTSNFYRRKNRLVFVGGSKDRWSALQRRIWRERERRERKKIPHVRPHRLVPSGEKLRWEHEEEEEKRREEKYHPPRPPP